MSMARIISELFVNLSIATAAIMFANMLMHEKYYSRSLKNSLINGFLSGLFGCLLMLYGVTFAPGLFIDFRYLPIILMGIYVSFTAAVETALIIGIFRVAYFGLNEASTVGLICAILIGVACGLVSRIKARAAVLWLVSTVSVCLIAGSGIFIVSAGLKNRFLVLSAFLIGTIFVSMIMYVFIEFITSFNKEFKKYKTEAEKDHLTGLINVRHFEKSLNYHYESAITDQRSIALLYLDIDYFKVINDSFGHAAGDLVLKELGRILKKMSRSHDVISRIGGEEFSILLIGCSLDQAKIVAERIRKTVEVCEFRMPNHHTARITVSIGISAVPETTQTEANLVKQADEALYSAKNAGRNRVAVAE